MSVRLHEPVKTKGSPPPRTRVAKSASSASTTSVSKALEQPDLEHMAKAQVAARDLARHAAVAREAYFRAERRGFAPGYELDDWLAAEAEVGLDGSGAIPSSIDDPVDERHTSPDVTPVR